MNAIKFVEELIGKNKRLFEIPPYQRNYAWDQNNCDQLLNDIINANIRNKSHFLGTILYVNYENNSELDRCLVIDGQQRLTTMLLLLKILLEEATKQNNEPIKNEITELLFNRYCRGEEYKIKLKPIKKDEEQLDKIFKNKLDELGEMTSNIVINYKMMKSAVTEKIDKGSSLENIFNGTKMLTIVEIPLQHTKDDAQAIFESINSTGKSLTITDKLRNYFLMNEHIDEQNKLYKDLWIPLEEALDEEALKSFFHDYLIMKEQKYIKESELYEEYKRYVNDKNSKRKDVLEDLLYFSKFYVLLLCKSIKKYDICKTFSLFRHNTIYPFLLKVCDDNEKKVITDVDFEKILKLFSNYALRRLVVNTPSASLRRFYANLYTKVFKHEKNKANYLKSITTYLCTLSTNDKFPNDTSFEEGLQNKNIYALPVIAKFLLEKIENNGSKEKFDFTNLTIEHIMPQELNDSWKKMLGDNHQEIYEHYLHTLGNLSMTGYNSEYSNSSYGEKKQKMKELKSKLVILNKEIEENDIWTKEQIVNRSKRLSKIILAQYPKPTEIDQSIKFDTQAEYTLEELKDLDYTVEDNTLKLTAYSLLDRKKKEVKYNYELLLNVCQDLYDLDENILTEMAKENFHYEKGTRPLASNNKALLRTPRQIKNTGIYLETDLCGQNMLSIIALIMKKYGLELSKLTISFVKKEE